MKNKIFALEIIISLLLLQIVNAEVSHQAEQITAGTFGQGSYVMHDANEVSLTLINKESGGIKWSLVSAGSLGGIGKGKFSIYDKTADSSRLTIDTNGRVGIGTESPGYKLDVAGDINAQSQLCIAGECKKSWLEVFGEQPWTISGANIYNKNPGNVGIGTTTPGTKLSILGDTHQVTLGSATASSYSGLIFQQSGTAKAYISYINSAGLGDSARYDNLEISTDSANTGGDIDFRPKDVSAMRITAAGNVGIGTTVPKAKLDVKGGSIKATDGLIIEVRGKDKTCNPSSPSTGQMWLAASGCK